MSSMTINFDASRILVSIFQAETESQHTKAIEAQAANLNALFRATGSRSFSSMGSESADAVSLETDGPFFSVSDESSGVAFGSDSDGTGALTARVMSKSKSSGH